MTRFQQLRLVVFERQRRHKLAAELQRLRAEGEQLRRINNIIARAAGLPIAVRVLNLLNGKPMDLEEIARRLELPVQPVSNAAQRLCQQGDLTRIRHGVYQKHHETSIQP